MEDPAFKSCHLKQEHHVVFYYSLLDFFLFCFALKTCSSRKDQNYLENYLWDII